MAMVPHTRSSGSPRPEFELFPNLPKELQLKIWKAALPGPQIVEVYLERRMIYNGATMVWVETVGVNRPPSILFHVCRTSRQVAKGKYTLQLRGFGSTSEEIRKARILDLSHSRVDPTEDTIIFLTSRKSGPGWLYGISNPGIWSKEAFAQIRYLSFQNYVLSESHRFVPNFFNLIMEFRNLQDLTICIFRENFENSYGRIPTDGFVNWPNLGTWSTWALVEYSGDPRNQESLTDLRDRIKKTLTAGWTARSKANLGPGYKIPNFQVKTIILVERDCWQRILQKWWDRSVASDGLAFLLHTR